MIILKKTFLFVLLFIAFSLESSAQNFTSLNDVSGDKISTSLPKLIEAANSLDAVFPEPIRDSFTVFDSGIYTFSDNFASGSDSKWAEIQLKVNTKYYLLFCRYTSAKNNETKIFVKFNLPTYGIFECFDLISSTYRNTILNELEATANNNVSIESSGDGEIKTINLLRHIIENKLCCDLENRMPSSSCDECLAFDTAVINGITYYPTSSLHKELVKNDFWIETVAINSDNEYYIPANNPAFKNSIPSSTRSFLGINAIIEFPGSSVSDDVDAVLTDIASEFENMKIYKFKYPRDCGTFQRTLDEFNEERGNAIFVVLINIDKSHGFLAYKYNSFGNGSSNRKIKPTEEDLEALVDAKEDLDGSCSSAIWAYAERFEYKSNNFFAQVYLSKDEYDYYYDEYYSPSNINTRKHLTEAQANLGALFDIEWKVQKIKYNRYLDWKTSLHAGIAICKNEIHGMLDICGVIEPIGVVCDATNFVIYGLTGDGKNCSLAAMALIPVAGAGAATLKAAGKFKKFQSATVSLSFKFKQVGGFVRFIGGHGKLAKIAAKTNFSTTFAGVSRLVGSVGTELQHIVPWQLLKDGIDQHAICKKLAKFGWHAGDPLLNGMVLPKLLPNGKLFHGNHPKYNDWMEDALETLDKSTTDDVMIYMDKLNDFLKLELEKAYKSNKSINEHFTSLPKLQFNLL